MAKAHLDVDPPNIMDQLVRDSTIASEAGKRATAFAAVSLMSEINRLKKLFRERTDVPARDSKLVNLAVRQLNHELATLGVLERAPTRPQLSQMDLSALEPTRARRGR